MKKGNVTIKIFNWLVWISSLVALILLIWNISQMIKLTGILSAPYIFGALLGASIVPLSLLLIKYLITRHYQTNDSSSNRVNSESTLTQVDSSNFEKQKSTIEDLIKSGIYTESEGKAKIIEIESRIQENKKNKEEKEKYDQSLESLKFLLKTNAISEDEFTYKTNVIKEDYLKNNFKKGEIIDLNALDQSNDKINTELNDNKVYNRKQMKFLANLFAVCSFVINKFSFLPILLLYYYVFIKHSNNTSIYIKSIFFIGVVLPIIFLAIYINEIFLGLKSLIELNNFSKDARTKIMLKNMPKILLVVAIGSACFSMLILFLLT